MTARDTLLGLWCRIRGHKWRQNGLITDRWYKCWPRFECSRCKTWTSPLIQRQETMDRELQRVVQEHKGCCE
jgi:hypothetical protein